MPTEHLTYCWWGVYERFDYTTLWHICPGWPVNATVEWRWEYGLVDCHVSAGTSLGFGVSLGLWYTAP